MGSGIAKRKAREAKAKQNGTSLAGPFGFPPRIFKALIIEVIASAVSTSYILFRNWIPPLTIPHTPIVLRNEDLALPFVLVIVVYFIANYPIPNTPPERRMMGSNQWMFIKGFLVYLWILAIYHAYLAFGKGA